MRLDLNLDMHRRKRQMRDSQLRPHRLVIGTPLLDIRHDELVLRRNVRAVRRDFVHAGPALAASLLQSQVDVLERVGHLFFKVLGGDGVVDVDLFFGQAGIPAACTSCQREWIVDVICTLPSAEDAVSDANSLGIDKRGEFSPTGVVVVLEMGHDC